MKEVENENKDEKSLESDSKEEKKNSESEESIVEQTRVSLPDHWLKAKLLFFRILKVACLLFLSRPSYPVGPFLTFT